PGDEYAQADLLHRPDPFHFDEPVIERIEPIDGPVFEEPPGGDRDGDTPRREAGLTEEFATGRARRGEARRDEPRRPGRGPRPAEHGPSDRHVVDVFRLEATPPHDRIVEPVAEGAHGHHRDQDHGVADGETPRRRAGAWWTRGVSGIVGHGPAA